LAEDMLVVDSPPRKSFRTEELVAKIPRPKSCMFPRIGDQVGILG
jgi:hypothetical protein